MQDRGAALRPRDEALARDGIEYRQPGTRVVALRRVAICLRGAVDNVASAIELEGDFGQIFEPAMRMRLSDKGKLLAGESDFGSVIGIRPCDSSIWSPPLGRVLIVSF